MASVATEQPFRLLDLPAEIRNLIYEHALRHDENAGFISPISPKKTVQIYPDNILLHTIVGGQACHAQCNEDIARSIHLSPFRGFNKDGFDHRAHLASGGSATDVCGHMLQDDGTKKPFIAHLCTAVCLLQPPLTRATRQVRAEALPVFYSVNHFNFDLETLHYFAGSSAMKEWWRAIGDTNLRTIKHLCINSPDVPMYSVRPFTKFSFSGGKGGKIVDIVAVPATSQPPDYRDEVNCDYSEAQSQMMEGGLFVRGIERVLYLGGVLGGDRVAW